MKTIVQRLSFFVAFMMGCITANAQNLKLHYDKPATFFEEAMVIGNGRLGGIVYGGINEDRISLNDITLWTGEPDLKPCNPEAYKSLPEVREALENEDYEKADLLAKKLQGHESEKYQPLGTLYISQLNPIADNKVSGYTRGLDIETAVARTAYNVDGKQFEAEYFVSNPDKVIAVRLISKAKEGINARIRLESLQPHKTIVRNGVICSDGYTAYAANSFYINGEHGERFFYNENRGIHYATRISAKNKGGQIVSEDSTLLVKGCKEVLILVANETNFNGADKNPVTEGKEYKLAAENNLNKAMTKSYATLRKAHVEDYSNLFGRLDINLGQTDAAIALLPTDVQLRRYRDGEKNPDLEELYFQYGRYLLISCSRTPGVPANLQGLWNEYLSAPWRSNYTININLEENYWGAETANLSELHMPLMQFVKQMQRTGKQTAQSFYNVQNGWCAGHNSDIWAMTSPVGEGEGGRMWSNWTMGGAWLSTHIWEHYMFTRNKEFLKEYYPTLRGAADFCGDWLIVKDNQLITSPSTSPENEFITDKGFRGSLLYGGTADLAITRECIGDALNAAVELGIDNDYVIKAANTIKALRPYQIGKRGQLLEWYHDWDDADWTHRHQSHLIGLYPGHHIVHEYTPDLVKAAARSLEIKGDMTTGWSTGWRVNLFARLHDGEGAYHMVRTLLKYISPDRYKGDDALRGGGTYPNLLDAHSPFQIDGNFGGMAGVIEMLAQSNYGFNQCYLNLLPALPEAWKSSGSVRGIRCRGGYEISFSWRDGCITDLELKSLIDEDIRVDMQIPGFKDQYYYLNAGETRKVIINSKQNEKKVRGHKEGYPDIA